MNNSNIKNKVMMISTATTRKKKKKARNAHVIKVTVLGLAGITVDPLKCNSGNGDRNIEATTTNNNNNANDLSKAPPLPSKMRAVVAFSRNNTLKGTTSLSRNLARSPNDGDQDQEEEQQQHQHERSRRNDYGSSMDVKAGITPMSPYTITTDGVSSSSGGPTTDNKNNNKSHSKQRHVAVWATEKEIGSSVTFEANLRTMGSETTFAPKSFDLTIALARDNDDKSPAATTKVALPFGLATLSITGHECKDGRPLKIDLPVLSMGAARPLQSAMGVPMIAIAPKQEQHDQQQQLNHQQEGQNAIIQPKNKRLTALQRIFKRTLVPNASVRNAFSSAYSMDSTGDAILRIKLQVYEKGSPLEKHFQLLSDTSVSSANNHPRSSLEKRFQHDHYFSDQDRYGDGSNVEEEYYTDISPSTYEYTEENDSDYVSFESSFVDTEDDNVAFFRWDNDDDDSTGISQIDDDSSIDDDNTKSKQQRKATAKKSDEDDYTLSFSKKPPKKKAETPPFETRLFGYKVRFPLCGAGTTIKDEDDARTLDTMETKTKLFNEDDITHVTADFFGRSYHIPICAALAREDEESVSTNPTTTKAGAEERNRKNKNNNGWTNLVECEPIGAERDKPFDMSHTFSTLSMESKHRPIPIVKPTSVLDFHKSRSNEMAKSNLPKKTPPLQKSESPAKSSNSSPKGVSDFEDSIISKSIKGPEYGQTQATPNEETVPEEGEEEQHKKRNKVPARKYTIANNSPRTQSWKSKNSPKSRNTLDAVLRYEPHQVPPIIIPKSESFSVGDLTANTHELACEAHILERYRQTVNEQEKRRQSRGSVPGMPIAFGGDGLCNPLDMTSSPIHLMNSNGGEQNSLAATDAVSSLTRENYFSEYDDYGMSPISDIVVVPEKNRSRGGERVQYVPSSYFQEQRHSSSSGRRRRKSSSYYAAPLDYSTESSSRLEL